MSCILATARGAVWAEHATGIGAADGDLQVLTRHALALSYSGDRLPGYRPRYWQPLKWPCRTAARYARTAVGITVDADLIIKLYEFQSAAWVSTPATKTSAVAHVVSGVPAKQGDDLALPDDSSDGDPN